MAFNWLRQSIRDTKRGGMVINTLLVTKFTNLPLMIEKRGNPGLEHSSVKKGINTQFLI